MTNGNESVVEALAAGVLGATRAREVAGLLEPMVPAGPDGQVTRAVLAAALNMALFADLLERVPSGAAYVADVRAARGTVCFDHGAIRTIRFAQGDTGALPAGELAFRRILEPLGYEDAALYPLPRLRMTGRAYRHRDFPETIPQFFVSELHVEQFSPEFAAAAHRVFGGSRDPLGMATTAALAHLSAGDTLPFAEAAELLPRLVAAFGRQHPAPMLDDYEDLRAESKEAAWIATEGNAFNHATDRVPDVVSLADGQKALGRPMKDAVEVSGTGRVRQTAYRADLVERAFVTPQGEVRIMVPGSFYEFISRDTDPKTGRLDLAFDSGNATGIFNMTKSV